MSNTQITRPSSDLNQMVVGLTGRAGSIENQLIAALMLYKSTANELEKQVNANSVSYGVAQGEAENAFYQEQSNMDKTSAGLKFGEAGADILASAAGEYKAGKQTVEGEGDKAITLDKDTENQNATIKKCNDEEIKLKAQKAKTEPAVGEKDESLSKKVNASDPNAPKTSKEIDEKIEANSKERKEAQKQVRRNSERRSATAQSYQRFGDTFNKTLQAGDKINTSIGNTAQGKHKQDEITNQMANQINQNVWKGFDTQKDTAASEITATISSYGAQGLGQANLHRPV